MIGTVYSYEQIKKFVDENIISSNETINIESQVQPSSFDLRCGFGKQIWHMPYSSIPQGNLIDFLDNNSTHKFKLDKKSFLHKNAVYIIELEELLNLPENICARSNPKSTTGRLDIHTRLITEGGEVYENVKENYNGKLFLEVISHSFDLFVPPGHSFNQIRFFKKPEKLNQQALEYLARSEDLLYEVDNNSKLTKIPHKDFIKKGVVNLTLRLDKDDPGYVAREDAPLVDLSSNKKTLPMSNYFSKVNINDQGLCIMPNSFYLLKTNEVISIPNDHCAEMADIVTELGEYRAHYAGFFDPGFKTRGIVEVRNLGRVPFLFRDRMELTSMEFYGLIHESSEKYGKRINSNYTKQLKVTPAKFFDVNK